MTSPSESNFSLAPDTHIGDGINEFTEHEEEDWGFVKISVDEGRPPTPEERMQ